MKAQFTMVTVIAMVTLVTVVTIVTSTAIPCQLVNTVTTLFTSVLLDRVHSLMHSVILWNQAYTAIKSKIRQAIYGLHHSYRIHTSVRLKGPRNPLLLCWKQSVLNRSFTAIAFQKAKHHQKAKLHLSA